jgi:hypothetical protein
VIKIKNPAPALARRVTHAHFTLSKISTVTFAVLYADKTISHTTMLLGHGSHSLGWRPPHAGQWTIELTAVDLAGNHAKQSAPVTVAKAHSAG